MACTDDVVGIDDDRGDNLMDTRKCFTMETGYTSSDFSFFRRSPNSLEVGRPECYGFQAEAGREKWYLVDTYTHYWKSGYGSDHVLVLVNDKGTQIETSAFGWRRVITEHEERLKEQNEYKKFIDALAECGKLCPNGASRWFNEAVLEGFEYNFEEILYYGTESN